MHYVSLVTVLLCIDAKIGGSKEIQRFVQTGSDVTLDIMDPGVLEDNYLVLRWTFNSTAVLVAAVPKLDAEVNERVVFHPQNSSVTLKNIQKENSGLYKAVLIKSKENSVLSTYSVSVLDPVSPVTVTVDSVSNSSESCNVTVSCSTNDHHVWHSFTCNNQTCEGKDAYNTTTPSGASLNLYLSNVSVICNHSNHVSWTNNTKNYRQACLRAGTNKLTEEQTPVYYYILPIVCVVIFILAVWLYQRRQRSNRLSMENTIYEVPNNNPQNPEVPMDSSTTTYSLVGPHTGPDQATVTREAPESLYATVDKPPKP